MRIYTASKIWHSGEWRRLRSTFTPLGIEFTARWIDLEKEDSIVVTSKNELWDQCREDVLSADCVVLFCGANDEEHRGSVMEAGMAFGVGKPVYCINTAKTFQDCAISDVAFTYHPLWNWIKSDSGEDLTIDEGFRKAVWRAQTDSALAEERRIRLSSLANAI